jgi:hypothetical protein
VDALIAILVGRDAECFIYGDFNDFYRRSRLAFELINCHLRFEVFGFRTHGGGSPD